MIISRHAQIRSQQRGIPESITELILEHGEPTIAVGNVMRYEVSGKMINSLQRKVKLLINQIERMKNKVVVVSDEGVIITSYHKKS